MLVHHQHGVEPDVRQPTGRRHRLHLRRQRATHRHHPRHRNRQQLHLRPGRTAHHRHHPSGSGSSTYNGLGQRVGKTVSGTTTGFVWDNNAVPNLLVDGTTRILYGPDNQPIEQTSSSGTFFFVHDQIGSTRTLLSTSGTVAGGYDYTPYGVPTHTGTATTNLQFSGQYTDPETGLIYLRARYYDPTTAQFLTIDPLIAVTGTPYAYVTGNPLNSTDPSGLCDSFWCWVALGAAAGAGRLHPRNRRIRRARAGGSRSRICRIGRIRRGYGRSRRGGSGSGPGIEPICCFVSQYWGLLQ